MAVPQRLSKRLLWDPSSSTPEEPESRSSSWNLSTYVHSCIIHSRQSRKPKCPSTDRRINQLAYNPCNRILFSHEKEQCIDICSQRSQANMLHVGWCHLYEAVRPSRIYRIRKQTNGWQGLGEGRVTASWGPGFLSVWWKSSGTRERW